MATKKSDLDPNEKIAYGVDYKNRTIFFGYLGESDNGAEDWSNSEFTFTNVEVTVRAIHEMASQSATKPITLRMNSGGGSLIDAFYLKDVILSTPCQFKFVGGGIIASAATIIMAVCDERHLYKDTIVMVHELSSGHEGFHSNSKVEVLVNEHMVDVMANVYAENSFMSKDYYNQLLASARDVHMWADEAVVLGLADRVIPHLKRGNLRELRSSIKKAGLNTDKLQKTLQKVHDRVGFKVSDNVKVRVVFDEVDENVVLETKEEV